MAWLSGVGVREMYLFLCLWGCILDIDPAVLVWCCFQSPKNCCCFFPCFLPEKLSILFTSFAPVEVYCGNLASPNPVDYIIYWFHSSILHLKIFHGIISLNKKTWIPTSKWKPSRGNNYSPPPKIQLDSAFLLF